MQNINNCQFGEFVAELRKEKNITQKQLAAQLFISDKAVSKWERGLSLPDVSLLIPLSKILDVTTTELLSGERIKQDNAIPLEQSNLLIEKVVLMKRKKINVSDLLCQKQSFKKSLFIILISTILSIVFSFILVCFFYSALNQSLHFLQPKTMGILLTSMLVLFLMYNLILLFYFVFSGFKKSICYFIFSPIFIISSIFLLVLRNFAKQLASIDFAFVFLQNATINYSIILFASLVAMLFCLRKYMLYIKKTNVLTK